MVRVKLDLSRLPNEFIFDSSFINSKQDLDSEVGFSEVQDAIMEYIKILAVEFVSNEE